MSQNNDRNRQGKRSARDRLREERERERAAERRRRGYLVAGGALGVLVIATVVGVIAAGQNGGDSQDGGGAVRPVAVGEEQAPATLTVYEDFRCPACGQFENGFRDTVHELTDSGRLRAEYHLVTIIDGNLGGDGSRQAANAALCARDEGRFVEYHDVLFANQPAETDDAFADTSHLLELAREVEGLDSEAFRDCVTSGEHADRVDRSNAAFLDSGYNATPTVLLNGEDVYGDAADPLTPERLRERVDEIAG